MTEPQQGYSVGTPKTNHEVLAGSWAWIRANADWMLKVGFMMLAIWCLMYAIGVSVRADQYEEEARADCYASGGLYANVGFGDDLCYLDGKVTMVYQA